MASLERMWYYIVDYQKTDKGWAPVLPDDTGFLLLASPGNSPPWGFFECDREIPMGPGVHLIPDTVITMINSAKRYPPALALARQAVFDEFEGIETSPESFATWYGESLRGFMREQRLERYSLLEAAHDGPGYLKRGAFYWVLGQACWDDYVDWVSSDYCIYQNHKSDFVWPKNNDNNAR
jgi:hypothetical protein